LLRGRDVQELNELQRQGMSIQAISKLTGWDRKTVRKYLLQPSALPEYGNTGRDEGKPASSIHSSRIWRSGCARECGTRRRFLHHPFYRT